MNRRDFALGLATAAFGFALRPTLSSAGFNGFASYEHPQTGLAIDVAIRAFPTTADAEREYYDLNGYRALDQEPGDGVQLTFDTEQRLTWHHAHTIGCYDGFGGPYFAGGGMGSYMIVVRSACVYAFFLIPQASRVIHSLDPEVFGDWQHAVLATESVDVAPKGFERL